MEKIISTPKILDERYEVEFVEDSEGVYSSGEYMDAAGFIDDYCNCCGPEEQDTAAWLTSIPAPEAVKFIAEAWGIGYILHKITTIDEIISR